MKKILEETAREEIEKKNINVNKLCWDKLFNFQKSIFEKQICKEKCEETFITDWWLYDMLNYCEGLWEKVSYFEEKIFWEKHQYDIVFVLNPNDCRLENDWIRHSDEKLREKIHTSLIKNLKKFSQKFLILSWTPEERKEKIKQIIK